jgi:hypothetical protein
VLVLHQPDDLGFLSLVISDEQIAPFSKLGVDEVIQGYGAVHYVGLGQAGPVMEMLQILCGLRYQRNSDPVSRCRPGNVSPGDVATRTGRHQCGSPSRGLVAASAAAGCCRLRGFPAISKHCPAPANVL